MKMLRVKEVEAITGYSRASIYVKMAQGSFPKPVKMGERMVAWIEAEVQDWIAARVKLRDTSSTR